jgi:hypothetical protein
MSSATAVTAISSAKFDVTEREFEIIEHAVTSEYGAAKDSLISDVMYKSEVDISDHRAKLKRYEDAKSALMLTRGWTNQRPMPQPVYLTGSELSEMLRDEVFMDTDSLDGFRFGDRAERAGQRARAERLLDVFNLHERLDAWASCDDLIEFHFDLVTEAS